MTLLLATAARATVGRRSGQEDAYQVWPAERVVPGKREGDGLLAVLADGMGGHTGGAIASQTACKTFTEVFAAASAPHTERLRSALDASNEAIAKGVEQNGALKGMGCTIVAAWIDDLGMRWASVGDSLLLLYRLPDVIRLNADHSLGSFLDEQARQNRITRTEARSNRNRNALRSALTGSKIDLVDLRGDPLELRPGDWLVLASDGICSLSGDEIADVIYRLRQGTPEEMADALIAAITEKQVVDQDNATIVAVRIDAADDAPTRVLPRPGAEDTDLITRRIGVSRRSPVPPRPRRTRAALWLAAAVALAFCAAATLFVLPALRPSATVKPEAASVPAEPESRATIDARPNVAPREPPARTAPEPPEGAPSPVPTERVPGDGDEGGLPVGPPGRSASTPPPDAPTQPAPEESVERGQPRAVPSRSNPPPQGSPAPRQPAGEERTGAPKTQKTKPAAAPKAAGASEGSPSRSPPPKDAARTRPAPAPTITTAPGSEEPRETGGREGDLGNAGQN